MSSSLLTDAVFWISLATIVVSAYKFSLTELYKSKCVSFKLCCGLVNVERNVDAEIKYDIENIQAHQEQDNKKHQNVIVEQKEEL